MGASSVKCEGRDKQGCWDAKFKHNVKCRWNYDQCLPPLPSRGWLWRADSHLNPRVDEVMETLLNNKWSKDESSNN